MPYIPYTDEQKQLANSINLPEFLRLRGETIEKIGRESKLIYTDSTGTHDSITMSGSIWYDHKNQIGGGPIKFMQTYYGMSFQEAWSPCSDIRSNRCSTFQRKQQKKKDHCSCAGKRIGCRKVSN